MSWAQAFELLRLVGAFYLIWIAWQTLKTPAVTQDTQPKLASLWKIFAQATLNSLLNPKALLFFMVFLLNSSAQQLAMLASNQYSLERCSR